MIEGHPATVAAALKGWTPSPEVVSGIGLLMRNHRERLTAEQLQRGTMSRPSGATAA